MAATAASGGCSARAPPSNGAVRSIGSTVEGVANTAAALRLAAPAGLDLPTARAVDLALTQDLTGERVSDQLRDLFRTVVSGSRPPVSGYLGTCWPPHQ